MIYCYECNESQLYGRENNREINIVIESLDPHCEIEALLSIDHETKSFIPKHIGPFLDCESYRILPFDIAKEFLRKRGKELGEEDFWKGYRFVDDFSKI